MKRFISVCLAILLVSLFYTSALADNTPPADQIAGNLYSDSGSWINPQKSGGFAISLTAYGIEKRSSTSIFVTGKTMTNQTADRVGVLITVQRWANNRWNNYSSTSNREYSADECNHSKTISVASGYYYRIHVTHTASLDTTSITKHSYSQSIYVN